MKLFFAIILLSTVSLSEASNLIDSHMFESIELDCSFELELEKEGTESIDEVKKVKFENRPIAFFTDEFKSQNCASMKWRFCIPYLEIHSPPPEMI